MCKWSLCIGQQPGSFGQRAKRTHAPACAALWHQWCHPTDGCYRPCCRVGFRMDTVAACTLLLATVFAMSLRDKVCGARCEKKHHFIRLSGCRHPAFSVSCMWQRAGMGAACFSKLRAVCDEVLTSGVPVWLQPRCTLLTLLHKTLFDSLETAENVPNC